MARLFSVVFLSVLGSGFAQDTRASDNSLIQALLTEVRQLRLAMERSALVVPRVQIALKRVEIQQGRVDRLSSQLQTVRQQITDSAAEDARLASAVKEMEARVTQEQDAARRRQMEDSIRSVKTEIEFRSTRDQQRRASEVELSSQLQTEQSKLNELSDELSRLEKSLGPPPPPGQ